MRKVCCMIALAAITLGSVYAGAPVPVKTTNHMVAQTDTTKSKEKKKGTKMKKKVKKDTTATKM